MRPGSFRPGEMPWDPRAKSRLGGVRGLRVPSVVHCSGRCSKKAFQMAFKDLFKAFSRSLTELLKAVERLFEGL